MIGGPEVFRACWVIEDLSVPPADLEREAHRGVLRMVTDQGLRLLPDPITFVTWETAGRDRVVMAEVMVTRTELFNPTAGAARFQELVEAYPAEEVSA